MRINPEFQRNVWLEMTAVRLVGMPAVLGAIFLLIYLTQGSIFTATMQSIAMTLFVVLVYIWGMRLASDAVINEMRDGTWDSQRMSSIGAWSMSWGKLFGSTVYPWYGGLICIAVYLIASIHDVDDYPYKATPVIIIAGVLAQAIALSSSLVQSKRNLVKERTSSALSLILAIFIVLPIVQAALNDDMDIRWYGERYDHYLFSIISLLVFTAWAITGIYRQMRVELQMRCTPLVWMVFISYIALYLAGFISFENNPEAEFSTRSFLVFGIFIATAYLMIFLEPKNPVAFRRLFYQLEHTGYRKAFYHVPVWIAMLLLVFVSVVVILFDTNPSVEALDLDRIVNYKILVVASVFFLMRDILIILYLNFGEKAKRADSAAMVYLFLLYFIIPGIFGVAGLPVLKAFFLPFSPDILNTENYFIYSMWSGLFQMIFMFWLLVKRWRVLNQETDGL